MKFDVNTELELVGEGTVRKLGLVKKAPIIATTVMLSLLSACKTLDTMTDSKSAVPETVSEIAVDKENDEKRVIKAEHEAKQEAAQKIAQADAMMASLQAPLKEPGVVDDQKAGVKALADTAKEKAKDVAEAKVASVVAEKILPEAESRQESAQQKQAEVLQAVNAKVIEVKESVAKVAPTLAKPFNVGKKDLPFNYDIWWVNYGDTALTQGLVISTPTWEMGKEGYMSQIWLTLKEDEIHINSSSDIATEAKDLGIRIDGGELIPFTRIAENNIAVIEGQWLDTLANGMVLDIYLGFFPDKKPVSDTFKSNAALGNLDRVVATYRELLK